MMPTFLCSPLLRFLRLEYLLGGIARFLPLL
jgi:hypothetical protein